MGVVNMDKQVTAILRDRGFKVTPQRLAIYRVLAATKAHPSAEIIFQQLQPVHPTMSLATVYKTIEMLVDVGLVQVLNVGEGSFRYDANTTSHPHIICRRCGRVDDLEEVDCHDFVDKVSHSTRYRLTGQQFYFYGYCPACQQELM